MTKKHFRLAEYLQDTSHYCEPFTEQNRWLGFIRDVGCRPYLP